MTVVFAINDMFAEGFLLINRQLPGWTPEKIDPPALYLTVFLLPNQEECENNDCYGNADNL